MSAQAILNPGNPWETASGATVQIADPIQALTASEPFTVPIINSNLTTAITSTQIENSLAGMNSIYFYVNGSGPSNFNSTQVLALANTIALFSNIAAGNVTFTVPQLTDLVIADQAIFQFQFGGTIQYSINPPVAVTLPFFPAPFTNVVNDQFFLLEQPGTGNFYVSNNGDGTTFTGLSFATSESYSDNLVAVDQLNGTIILFGAHSIEYWYDTGSQQFTAGEVVTFPYQRVDGYQQTWGLAARYSRQKFQNGLAFLGEDFSGSVQVCWLQQGTYTPVVISNSDIEEIINTFSVKNDAIARVFTLNTHTFYQITFPTARRSFLYDGLTQMWSEVQSGTLEYDRHMTNFGESFNQTNVVSDWSNGNIYWLNPLTYTDNGYFIRREIDTMHVQNEGNLFSVAELWLDCETGGGNQSGYGTNPQMMMSYSTDNGKTFIGEYWASMGMVGQYLSPRVTWRRLGISRDYVFKFVMTEPVPFNVIGGSALIVPQVGG